MWPRVLAGCLATLVLALLTPTHSTARGAAADPPASFAPAVQAVERAVLSVVVRPSLDEIDTDLDDLDAARVLAQIFAGDVPRRTLGAAVVLDRAGLALTSLRTLRGLEEVDVITVDGVRLPASVAARDEQTDLAVLRIAGPAELSAARLGDSDAVRVGDWVLAVGAPYGLEASVSAGIVSARARSRPDAPHEETLQTDAAVNPGSIGGPLVDVRGDVVGILMVPGPRGGGIGFAVTSNLARRVARDLLAHGRVIRGWLGVSTQSSRASWRRRWAHPAAAASSSPTSFPEARRRARGSRAGRSFSRSPAAPSRRRGSLTTPSIACRPATASCCVSGAASGRWR